MLYIYQRLFLLSQRQYLLRQRLLEPGLSGTCRRLLAAFFRAGGSVAVAGAMAAPAAAGNSPPYTLELINASDAGTPGKEIRADDARIVSDHPISAAQGATALHIIGQRADVQRVRKTLNVNGSQSVGIKVKGHRARLSLDGGGRIVNGATGIAIDGNQAQVRLSRPFNVGGPLSTGVRIVGYSARALGEGFGTVLDRATAFHIIGDRARVELYDPALDQAAAPQEPGGIIPYQLPVSATTGPASGQTSGQARPAGSVTAGATGIRISGIRSMVRLHDSSTIDGADSYGVVLESPRGEVYRDGGSMRISGGGTGIAARGAFSQVSLQAGTTAVTGNGSTGIMISAGNTRLDTRTNSLLTVDQDAVGIRIAGSRAQASLGGRITVGPGATALQAIGQVSPDGIPEEGAMAINGHAATITARGLGASGMAASGQDNTSLPHLINRGLIDIDPLHLEAGKPAPAPEALAIPVHELGFGLSVSAPLGGQRTTRANATNEGTITVHNAGVGMVASFPGAIVTNQGIINLEADASSRSTSGRHYGMVALNGATALNDTQGVINVNADGAQAFHADSSSILINRGAVNLNGVPMPEARLPHQPDVTPTGSDDQQFVVSAPLDLGGRKLSVGGQGRGASQSPTGTPLAKGSNRMLITSTLSNGTLFIHGDGTLTNDGSARDVTLVALGTMRNALGATLTLSSNKSSMVHADMVNSGTLTLSQPLKVTGTLTNRPDGSIHLSGAGALRYGQGGTVVNHGNVIAEKAGTGKSRHAIYVASPGGGLATNTGKLVARDGYGIMTSAGPMGPAPRGNVPSASGTRDPARSLFINRGSIDFTATGRTRSALRVHQHTGHDLLNDEGGEITVRGDKAMAMHSNSDSQLVNRGIINLGEKGTTDTGMAAMVLSKRNTSGAIVNDDSGVINVHASRSHAFQIAGTGSILINRGKVNLLCPDKSCGVFRNTSTRGRDVSGTEADTGFVFNPLFSQQKDKPEPQALRATRSLAGYVIGTRPDGGAGTLDGAHLDASAVSIDTTFATGTASRQARFDKVLRGSRIDGIEHIRSRSAAWHAQAYRDGDGDVGVMMTKNDYRQLVPDAALQPIAAAMEQGYDGSPLFRSLELASVADIGHALRQLSGAGIAASLQPLRTLEQRFTRFSDDMPGNRAGFGFRLVGSRHGQPEARLGSSTYDLVALRQRFELGHDARLTARYGFASVKSGSTTNAGLNGRSQLFGLHYAQPLGRAQLEGEFRYTQHQAGTRRTLRYGDVNLQPRADQRRDQFSSQFSLAMPHTLASGLTLEPLLGLKLRHQRDAALTERDAGTYALRLSAARDSAVDGVLGLRVRYDAINFRNGRGWRADAELLGRPTLYRQAGIRQAGFASVPAAGRFELPASGNHRLGYDGKLGLSHHGRDSRFEVSAFASRDNGASDVGLSTSYRYAF